MRRVITVMLVILEMGGVVAVAADYVTNSAAQTYAATSPANANATGGDVSLAPTVWALQTVVSQQATQISQLDTRVTALETRMAKGESSGAAPTAVPTEAKSGQTASGTGTMVSEKFHLKPGRYKVSAVLKVADFSGFIVNLNGPDGVQVPLFNELIQGPKTWTGSTVITIDTAGDYFVDVTNTTGSWKLTFEPY